MTIESLDTRVLCKAGDYVPWRYEKAAIDAAAGGVFKAYSTVATETRRSYVIGTVDDQIAVAALGVDGRIDTTFGGTGVVRSPTGRLYPHISEASTPSVAAADTSGNLYLATGTEVVKFRFNGRRDFSFGTRGVSQVRPDLAFAVDDVVPTFEGGALVVYHDAGRFMLYNAGRPQARRVLVADSQQVSGLSVGTVEPDALLRKTADGYVLVYRYQALKSQVGGLPSDPSYDVVRTANDLKLVHFTDKLAITERRELPIDLEANLQDVRVFGQIVSVATDRETVQFRPDNILRRRVPVDPRGPFGRTALAPDGTRWTAYDAASTDQTYFTLHRTDIDGSPVDGTSRIHANGASLNHVQGIDVTDNGNIVFSGGFVSGNRWTVQRFTPEDGPKVAKVVLSGHNYVHISYAAPFGISKASIDQPRLGARTDLLITGPGGVRLNSGTSGFYRLEGGGWTARYWIEGPGGNWDPTDNGTYTIRLRAGEIADGVGVLNTEQRLTRFTVNLTEPS